MESVPEASDKPKRIQLSRRKGWRKPEGAIVVARPSKWGNPWKVGQPWGYDGESKLGREDAVELYRRRANSDSSLIPVLARSELAGHDLACWCPLDQPCHADVLLEIANR